MVAPSAPAKMSISFRRSGQIRLDAVADGGEVCREIPAILRRQVKREGAVEMRDHLVVSGVAPVMEIRRVEIGVEQGRRLEQAARADIVLAMVDESAGWHMAGGAAHGGVARERLAEQRLAPACGDARALGEAALGPELRIGQEVDILDVSDERVENARGRLGSGELADDDVVDEVAQRCEAAVMAIGGEIACAAQTRRRHRIEYAIVGLGVEQRTRRVEIAGPSREARDEQLGVAGAVDVTGAAAHAGLPRDAAEDGR